MGESATDDRNEGDLLDDGDDAPWRPDFDGWATEVDDSQQGAHVEPPALEFDADPAELLRWSRAHAEREPEPWVPERPARRPRAMPPESPEHPVVEVSGQPPSSTTGEVVLGALVVAALAVGALVVGVALRPAEVSDVDPTATVVAAAAEQRWTVEFDTSVDDVGVGLDTIAVAVDGEIVAIDTATGDVRWRREPAESGVDVDRIVVVDPHVLVQQREGGGRSELRTYAVDTGEPGWDTVGDDGVVTISGRDDDALLIRRVQVGGDATVEVLDPATGEPVSEPLRLSGVTAAGDDTAVQPTDRRVAIWSRAEGAVVAGPVDEFNLRMAADVDGAVVALDREGRVVLFDQDGVRVDELPFVSEAFGEFTSRPELVGVVDGVGVVASGTTIGFALRDDSIEPVWTREGRAQSPVSTAAGPVAVLVGPEPSGQIRETLIDPVDGSTIVVTDPEGKRERSPVLGHNGYVLAPIIGAPARTLSAFDYDGNELWSTELPGRASFELAHELLVIVEQGADGSVVGLAR